ncbi:Transcriptional regulator [Labilithrix luteola]|uniref:Transcriptional regulator n=1 Tax=Labilithrix luteola TaxID=1391654 RepID=A0A0K1QB70_9BACT|nr:hypothetical protein [Labilithrix luteola]AKV03036.1 Transcriptional regulator [Labilithrix luteola]
MRPNLSIDKIAGALAVLGTSVLMGACGGESKPAEAPVSGTEVAPAGEKAGEHKAGEANCSADHKGSASCGAGKGSASCGAGKADPAAAAPATTPAAAAPAAAAPAAADAKADSKAPAAAPTGSSKKPATPPAAGKKAGGASCGAGTCSAKK